MTGVVLCGGASSRMGQDKGLLPWQNKTFSSNAYDVLSRLGIPVVISVNNQNYSAYQAQFSDSLLIRDDANLPVGGPLKGLLSVHQNFQDEDLLVLAVDMPQMHVAVLKQLINAHQLQDAEACVFQSNKGLEPLCGIYAAGGLSKISSMLREGKLSRFSMHYILAQLHTKLLPLDEELLPFFANYNEPSDLAKLGM